MRPIHAALSALLLISASGVALAQPGAPAAPAMSADPATVAAGTYSIDPNHSQVLFTYQHMGLTFNMGLLSGATGSLTIDPKSPNGAKLSVSVPINTLKSTIAKLDEEFQSKMFFDAAQFPTATFESTSVAVSGKTAKIAGNLTIHGVTKPATIDATFLAGGANPMSKKPTMAFNGTTTIKRSDFGLGLGVPMVADQVKLNITVQFDMK
ncbi:MAG: YceI family protein [Sphingobium sp.]|nr:YceI family protein [Sphingobium sp.]